MNAMLLVVPALASLSGCGRDAAFARPPARVALLVDAASSAREPLLAIERIFERDRPIDVVLTFGSSGDLARRILEAGEADVFLSADALEMDRIAGRIDAETRVDLLSNTLVVIEPIDPSDATATRFVQPFDPRQLADERIRRLALGRLDRVPIGRYSRAWLERAGVWSAVEARVVPCSDTRAVLGAVESGAADAGIVYATDAARSTKVRVVHAIPSDETPRIVYTVAVLKDRPHASDARAFVKYLASDASRAIFESFGFVIPDAAAAQPK
jgi:molybdate transport system substrate-binding protein